jgi:hypothetical protein
MQTIQQGSIKSIRAASITYDISYSTLLRRVKECLERRDSRPASCKLTETEESTLVEWILSMDQRGLAPTSNYVQQIANLLLQKRSAPNQANPTTISKR